MPSPSTSLATQSPELMTYFEGIYDELSAEFVGQQVFPVLPVPKQSGTFGKVSIEEMLKAAVDIERSPGAGYWTDEAQFTATTYTTKEYGLQERIDDREREMYSDYLQADRFAIARSVNKLLTAAEIRIANTVMDTAVYTGGTLSQAVQNGLWSAANSTPISDFEAAVAKFYTNTGMWPNCMVINRKVFRALRNHAEIIARITSSGAGDQARAADVTAEQLARVFAIDRVLVAGGTKNTANINAAAALSQIWPNHAMVCRVATSQDMQESCIGRTFHWSADGSQPSGIIETYRDEARRCDIVRVRHELEEKLIHTEMGLLIATVI